MFVMMRTRVRLRIILCLYSSCYCISCVIFTRFSNPAVPRLGVSTLLGCLLSSQLLLYCSSSLLLLSKRTLRRCIIIYNKHRGRTKRYWFLYYIPVCELGLYLDSVCTMYDKHIRYNIYILRYESIIELTRYCVF